MEGKSNEQSLDNNLIEKLIKQFNPCVDDIHTICELDEILDPTKNLHPANVQNLNEEFLEWTTKVEKNYGQDNRNLDLNSKRYDMESSKKDENYFYSLSDKNNVYLIQSKCNAENCLGPRLDEILQEKNRIQENLDGVIKRFALSELQKSVLDNNIARFSEDIATEQLLLQKKPELKSSVSDEEVYMSSSESLVELYKHSSHPSEENINKRNLSNSSCNCDEQNAAECNGEVYENNFNFLNLHEKSTQTEENSSKYQKLLNLINEAEIAKTRMKEQTHLKAEFAKLKEENDLLRESFSSLIKSNCKDQSHLDCRLIDSYQSQIVKYEMEKSDISSELCSTKSHLERSLKCVWELKKKNQELAVRNEQQERLIESMYRESNILKEIQLKCDETVKENEELKAQIDIKARQNDVLNSELLELKSKDLHIAELEDKLRCKEIEVDQLNNSLQDYQKMQLENEKIIENMRVDVNEKKRLTTENNSLKNMMNTVTNENQNYLKQLKEFESREEKAKTSQIAFTVKTKKSATIKTGKKNEIMYSKVKHECEHFKQDLGKKCEEFKKLEKEFAKQRKLFLSELNSVKQEKRDLQIRMFEFENQKHELENNLIDVDMQTDKLKLSLNDARTQKKLLEENNQELKSNLQKCYKENFELDNKIGVLEGRIHDYEINSKELQNENDCLQEQIRELFSLRKQFFDIKLLIGNLDNYRQIFQKSFNELTLYWKNELCNAPNGAEILKSTQTKPEKINSNNLYDEIKEIEQQMSSMSFLLEFLLGSKCDLKITKTALQTTSSQTENANVVKKQVKKFTIKQPVSVSSSTILKHLKDFENVNEYEVRYFTHLIDEGVTNNQTLHERSFNNLWENSTNFDAMHTLMKSIIYLNNNDNKTNVSEDQTPTVIASLILNRLNTKKTENLVNLQNSKSRFFKCLNKLKELECDLIVNRKVKILSEVEKLSKDVEHAYEEAEKCIKLEQETKLLNFYYHTIANLKESQAITKKIGVNSAQQMYRSSSTETSQEDHYFPRLNLENQDVKTAVSLCKMLRKNLTTDSMSVIVGFLLIMTIIIFSNIFINIHYSLEDNLMNNVKSTGHNFLDFLHYICRRRRIVGGINPV